MSGGLFALRTGATWMLLLPADNWDMMVYVYSTYILYGSLSLHKLIHAGGYTNSTRSYSNIMTVDPVEYHCSGRESNLQTCDNETVSWTRCSNWDVTTIACVRRNASGIHVRI